MKRCIICVKWRAGYHINVSYARAHMYITCDWAHTCVNVPWNALYLRKTKPFYPDCIILNIIIKA